MNMPEALKFVSIILIVPVCFPFGDSTLLDSLKNLGHFKDESRPNGSSTRRVPAGSAWLAEAMEKSQREFKDGMKRNVSNVFGIKRISIVGEVIATVKPPLLPSPTHILFLVCLRINFFINRAFFFNK
jgi:hypothetical protein